MRSIKPSVYKMNSRGSRTDPRATPNRKISCRTASHTLHPVRQVWLEPVQCSTSDTERDLEQCHQNVVVDGVKCCGEVEQNEDRQVAIIECIQNFCQYFQHSRLSRVTCPICGLQAWQKVCCGSVRVAVATGKRYDREVWTPAIISL